MFGYWIETEVSDNVGWFSYKPKIGDEVHYRHFYPCTVIKVNRDGSAQILTPRGTEMGPIDPTELRK